MNKKKKLPSIEEFIESLENSLIYCREADDRGSIHFCMGHWQEWVKKWPKIFTKEGGI